MDAHIEEIKESIRKNIKWEVKYSTPKGGQTTGKVDSTQVLYSEELNIRIEVGSKKSTIKNRDLALTLFELAMDEIIK